MAPQDSPPRRMFDIQDNRLCEDGSRQLDIELTALRTHRADVDRALRAKSAYELSYEVSLGSHKKVGFIDLDAPKLRLRFAPEDPDGVWEARIVATDLAGRWQRQLWCQRLLVQKRLRRSAQTIAALAQRYAPAFVFSATEQYFPVSLKDLLDNPILRESAGHIKIKTIFGREAVPVAELGEFMRFNGHKDYLLDFNFLSMKNSPLAQAKGDPASATVYYSYFEDPHRDRFFINYHLIYAFDTKAGLARLSGIGPHVFDRESMVLVFEGERPKEMVISGHLENQTIFLLEKLKLWTQGRIRVRFDDERTLKLGDHPVIAVADGSHALYPTSGVYHLGALREVAGHLDPDLMSMDLRRSKKHRAHIKPEQILMPPRLTSKSLHHYDLQSFAVDRLTSHINTEAKDYDGHNAYLTFSGYWVDVAGTRNARFPPSPARKVRSSIGWKGPILGSGRICRRSTTATMASFWVS